MKSLTYFKSLSDITRIRLLNILLHHELSVNEIVGLMEMGQSRISRHLKILTDAGLLACRRDGVWAFYSTVTEGEGQGFIDAVGYLFDDDPVFAADLSQASRIVEERRLTTRRFFNTIAPEWDLLKLDILGDFDLNAAICEQVGRCGVVADLGCGTGDLLVRLKAGAARAIGVDSSPRMLEEARKRFSEAAGAVELRLGELEHLPLSDGEADCAVLSMALHHIDEPAGALREVARTLGAGGSLVIADFDKHGNETMRKTYGDRWLGFSRAEMERFLSGAGFTLEDVSAFPLRQSLTLCIYRAVRRGEGDS